MSAPLSVEPRAPLPFHRRLVPFLAVCVAHLVGRLPPRRIRQLLTACSRGARPADHAEAAAARSAVVSVSISCAGSGCLPRSLATVLLCRVRGTWPTWCSGVRTVPFTAHAWVEAEGRPVDEPDTLRHLHTLITVPPPRAGARTRSEDPERGQ